MVRDISHGDGFKKCKGALGTDSQLKFAGMRNIRPSERGSLSLLSHHIKCARRIRVAYFRTCSWSDPFTYCRASADKRAYTTAATVLLYSSPLKSPRAALHEAGSCGTQNASSPLEGLGSQGSAERAENLT